MGSVLTENPKGGIAEDFGTIQRGGGGTQIFFANKDLGDRESHQKQESSLDQKLLGGDHFSEVTFQGGIG